MLSVLGKIRDHVANHVIIKTFLSKRCANDFSRQVDDRDNLKKRTVMCQMINKSLRGSMTPHESKVDSCL